MCGGIEYSDKGQYCHGDDSPQSFTTECSDHSGGNTRSKLSWADIRDSDSEDEVGFGFTCPIETSTTASMASLHKFSSDIVDSSEHLPRLLSNRSGNMSTKLASKPNVQRRRRPELKEQQQLPQQQKQQQQQQEQHHQQLDQQQDQKQTQRHTRKQKKTQHERERCAPFSRQSPGELQAEGIDTLMIRNLNPRMKQSELVTLLKDYGFDDQYCFLYMPRSLETKKAKGYAFVVFDTIERAADCMRLMHGEMVYGSKLDISAAVVQGFDTNVKKWCSRGSRIKSPELKPYIRPKNGS